MIMTKKVYYSTALSALLAVTAVLPSQAQQYLKIYNGNISVQANELKQQGDSLLLTMNLDIPTRQIELDSRKSLELIPVLEGSKGRMAFPSILINGRNRNKAYKRKVALGDLSEGSEPYAVVRKGELSVLHYVQQVPYESWMDDSHLNIVEDLCGCAGTSKASVQTEIFPFVELEQIEVYVPQPKLAYITPAVEQIKRRAEVKDVFLDFKIGSAAVINSLNRNADELQKVETMINEVKEDGNVKITGLVFKGYASPEGSVASNLRLSDARARSMKDYLISRISLGDISIKSEGVGEDWTGLEKLLSESSVQDKNKLLDIIQQCGTTDACEAKMRGVVGGVPYRQMLSTIYPRLRRTVCSVDYTVKGFSIEEGKEVIKSHPQQLSMNEMYLVANSYPAGCEQFNEVFETAVRMFPNDDVANLNAANSAIERGDLISAEKYLDRVNTARGEAQNSRGILYMLKGDYDNAEAYLRRAEHAGVEAASINLNELAKKRENDFLINQKKRK